MIAAKQSEPLLQRAKRVRPRRSLLAGCGSAIYRHSWIVIPATVRSHVLPEYRLRRLALLPRLFNRIAGRRTPQSPQPPARSTPGSAPVASGMPQRLTEPVKLCRARGENCWKVYSARRLQDLTTPRRDSWKELPSVPRMSAWR